MSAALLIDGEPPRFLVRRRGTGRPTSSSWGGARPLPRRPRLLGDDREVTKKATCDVLIVRPVDPVDELRGARGVALVASAVRPGDDVLDALEVFSMLREVGQRRAHDSGSAAPPGGVPGLARSCRPDGLGSSPDPAGEGRGTAAWGPGLPRDPPVLPRTRRRRSSSRSSTPQSMSMPKLSPSASRRSPADRAPDDRARTIPISWWPGSARRSKMASAGAGMSRWTVTCSVMGQP